MARSFERLCLVLLAAFTVSACVGAFVGRGISHYQAGEYHAAMQVWLDAEPHHHQLNQKGLVRYLVFRGLTHYRLGQRDRARRYLTRGRDAYRYGRPEWLPAHARMDMDRALVDLGVAPSVGPPGGGA